jgi:MFS-type transporter involved in bile tolerance (Atg22 family)
MALMVGFLLQGAGLGQTLGPLMVSSVVEIANDWNYANLVVIAVATIGLSCALLLRRRS